MTHIHVLAHIKRVRLPREGNRDSAGAGTSRVAETPVALPAGPEPAHAYWCDSCRRTHRSTTLVGRAHSWSDGTPIAPRPLPLPGAGSTARPSAPLPGRGQVGPRSRQRETSLSSGVATDTGT